MYGIFRYMWLIFMEDVGQKFMDTSKSERSNKGPEKPPYPGSNFTTSDPPVIFEKKDMAPRPDRWGTKDGNSMVW